LKLIAAKVLDSYEATGHRLDTDSYGYPRIGRMADASGVGPVISPSERESAIAFVITKCHTIIIAS
jgi:hypothetical protein